MEAVIKKVHHKPMSFPASRKIPYMFGMARKPYSVIVGKTMVTQNRIVIRRIFLAKVHYFCALGNFWDRAMKLSPSHDRCSPREARSKSRTSNDITLLHLARSHSLIQGYGN